MLRHVSHVLVAQYSLLAALFMFASLSNAQQPLRPAPQTEDGPNGLVAVVIPTQRSFAFGNFGELERLFAQLNSPEQRLLDGRWKLSGFAKGLEDFVSGRNQDQWPSRLAAIQQWRKQYPRSSAAAAAEAMYWRKYAWHARGSGFISTVTKEGAQLFNERMQKAERVLRESRDYGPENPLWFSELMEVARASGWPLAEYRKLFEEATSKAPAFYPHYISMVERLLPMWDGSYVLIDEFVAQSVAKTLPAEGTSLYARLYWHVGQRGPEGFDLFKESKVSWPRLRKGFEDLQARTPNSHWNMNAFASFACRAGDRKTYTRLRSEMKDNVYPEAWASNYSLDLCDHKFPRLKG